MSPVMNELVAKANNFRCGESDIETLHQAAYEAVSSTPRYRALGTKKAVCLRVVEEMKKPNVPSYMLEDARRAEYNLLFPHGE